MRYSSLTHPPLLARHQRSWHDRDGADLRRGAASAPAAFGNKYAIYRGDFLLGHVTTATLSRLGESEGVELIASVITASALIFVMSAEPLAA